jgi:transglutaminase-like putative cysteine protease
MGTNLTPIMRRESGILSPDTVLARGHGACRDLTVCAMAVCRAVGLPARFVSGYQEGDPMFEERDLHAWFEVWLPGGGWRGYDPTHGLAVADRHVALAVAPEPEGAAPVVGAFRGDGASVELSHDVRLEMY